MKNEFKNDFSCFKYYLIDIRKINCNKLLESDDYEDKVLSILCHVGNPDKLIGKLTEDMLKLKENERADFLKKLFLLSRLRPKINVLLGSNFEKEEKKMPIKVEIENIEKDPMYIIGEKKGLKKGIEKGVKEGIEKKEREDIIRLFKELKLSPNKIAKGLKIPVSKVKKILKEEKLL